MRNFLRSSVLVALCMAGFDAFAQTLLHYWNFNNTSGYQAHVAPSSSLVNGASLDTALFSGGGPAVVDVSNGTGQGFDVNNHNARNNDAAGNHLRFNNPLYGALIFSVPTTGYKDIVIRYASLRSGSGAYYQFIHYTTDGSTYIPFDTIEPTTMATLYTLDFSQVTGASDNARFKVRITFGQGGGGTAGNNRFDNFTVDGRYDAPLSLIHYWNFNQSSSQAALLAPSTANVNGAGIDTILFPGGGPALVDYANGTGQGFDQHNHNARNNDAAGTHLRFNNPIYGALVFSLPTTGYRDVLVKYAGMRSGSGAYHQLIHYTTDGTVYHFFDTVKPGTAPTLYTLDFSSVPGADNNPDFKVRITFEQGGGGTAGNNRFDNFTLEGYSLGGADSTAPTVSFSPVNNATDVDVNVQPTLTFSENVRLVNGSAVDHTNADTLVELRVNDQHGTPVAFDASVNGRVITLAPSSPLAASQVYYLALKAGVLEDMAGNAISLTQSVTFTTRVPQTEFAAGDLVPVAYRMNASNADDEVALLTFVNILPGTRISFTDAKFTSGSPAQCPGGLVWTAPASGVAAGTVISVKNDAGVVSTGTLGGSNFGLSSGGDQFIVYTGLNTDAKYITALSSNAWLSSNTSCSGSSSMLPAGLADGVSSIQFSTTRGHVNGNTANAFYAGPQAGTPGGLRAAILDTANWVGAPSGSPAQSWPAWSFPGPPSVTAASVLNANTIRLVFSKDLDSSSAADTANFTGIAGLASVVRTNNGPLADTLTLNYSVAFAKGSSNTLIVSGVKDAGDLSMFAPYSFSFAYNTSLSFTASFASVKEDTGTVAVTLNLSNPSVSSARLVVKASPFSTASAGDVTLLSQTLSFTGSSLSTQVINIPVVNDNLAEQDEYLVLALEDPDGLTIGSTGSFTLFIRDDDKQAPAAKKDIELKYVGSFDPSPVSGSTTEIVVYDSASRRLVMTSAIQDRFDVADFSRPDSIVLVRSVDMAPYGGVTSVAVKNGLIAVASPNANEQLDGSVVFFSINGDFLKQVTVGALPDMVTFTPDGRKVLTANEGQPDIDYTVDPEGSVSVIDLSGGIAALSQAHVKTLFFTAFNAQDSLLQARGVRRLKLSSTFSQDLEPEFVTVSDDSKKAWVTLQENNAIAAIDLETDAITCVWPLGMKDMNAEGNGFDASDNSGYIHLANYPVRSFYIPDAIGNYSVNGSRYLVTANEGDEKEYNGLNERTTVGAVLLDSSAFPHAGILKESHHLGRLRITNLSGDKDGDGDYDELHTVGTRSFSIWDAANGVQVYDSGDDFERITSTDPAIASLFNADNEGNGMKSRSRAKGPEPEGLTLAEIDGKQFAFIALERVGGVMAYDISNPSIPVFQDYKNSRSLTSYAGDHGPEGITYISPLQSPDGKAYLTVANEISGTVSVYEVKNNMPPSARFARASAAYKEGAAGDTVRIILDRAVAGPSSVTVRVSHLSASASDYRTNPAFTGDSLVLTIDANSTSAGFAFAALSDQAQENTESLSFTITGVSGNIRIGSDSLLHIDILDSTAAPASVIGFASSGQSVSEKAGTVTVSLSLSKPLTGPGRAVLKAIKGTGFTNNDFSSNPPLSGDSLVLSLSAGATGASFSLTIVDDHEREADETLSFVIARTEGDMLIGSPATYTLTILDDDSISSGTNEPAYKGKNIVLYPNPVSGGKVFFSEKADAALYDMQGRLLKTVYDAEELSLDGLAKGLYHIRLNGSQARKLLIE